MLYKSASKQWQKDPDSVLFIERDGTRFKYILDYMRDGKVDVPMTETQASILAELEYFGIDVVDKNLVKYSTQLMSYNGYLEFRNNLMNKNRSSTLAIFVLDQLLKQCKTLKPQETRYIDHGKSPEIKDNVNQYRLSIPEANDILKTVGLKVESISDSFVHVMLR
jgi:hypothetical protein